MQRFCFQCCPIALQFKNISSRPNCGKHILEPLNFFHRDGTARFSSSPQAFQIPAPCLPQYLTDLIHCHFLHHSLQSSNADELWATRHRQTCSCIFLNSEISQFSFNSQRLVIMLLAVPQVTPPYNSNEANVFNV